MHQPLALIHPQHFSVSHDTGHSPFFSLRCSPLHPVITQRKGGNQSRHLMTAEKAGNTSEKCCNPKNARKKKN